MAALDALGIALLAGCLLLGVFVLRRRLLARRGGTVEMSARLRHWTFGLARYDGDRLEWFRTFSLSPRPHRSFDRARLHVRQRRAAHAPELVAFVPDAVVLVCVSDGREVELAMPASTANGFLAWLEAGRRTPPSPPIMQKSGFSGPE